MAVTQFEPSFARAAFPCVDQPSAKASYEISLGAEPEKLVLSNMPEKTDGTSGVQVDHIPGYYWTRFEGTLIKT